MLLRPYRILITGSRNWTDPDAVFEALAEVVRKIPLDRETVLVEGEAAGPDLWARSWGEGFGLTIDPHRADWRQYGRPAGMIRNQLMVGLGANVCLAFIAPCVKEGCPRRRRGEPHGSHGATQCAELAEAARIPVEYHRAE